MQECTVELLLWLGLRKLPWRENAHAVCGGKKIEGVSGATVWKSRDGILEECPMVSCFWDVTFQKGRWPREGSRPLM